MIERARESVNVGNVGCRDATFTDAIQSARIPLHILYPTQAAATTAHFGPYALDVATNAAPIGDDLRLVLISHGTGGSPWVYRDLAAHLVRAGFVVAMIEHTGNCRNDNALENTTANLENRPRHLHLAIEAIFSDEIIAPHLSKNGVAVIGHSMGGYAALAIAGGAPTAFPNEAPDGQPRLIDVTHDHRVKALVLLAPAAAWYREERSLAKVHVPILMLTGEKDPFTPPFHSEWIKNRVEDNSKIDHRVVPNAGHFAFMSPFPIAMIRPDFPPSQDPAGFDRAAYQPILYADVERFLRAQLQPALLKNET